MLIVFYVSLVWLKVILGNFLLLLWLWIARDRGVSGAAARLNYAAALLVWAAPWVLFLIIQADLYQGHCGLRQGIRDCSLWEFLWGRLRWLRYGLPPIWRNSSFRNSQGQRHDGDGVSAAKSLRPSSLAKWLQSAKNKTCWPTAIKSPP